MQIRKLLKTTEFKKELENDKLGLLLDVRMPEEFDEDRICDAVSCDYVEGENDFKVCLSKLDKTKHYYVYCMTGRRSAEACDIMEELGFPHIVDLEGGMLRYDGKLCED